MELAFEFLEYRFPVAEPERKQDGGFQIQLNSTKSRRALKVDQEDHLEYHGDRRPTAPDSLLSG